MVTKASHVCNKSIIVFEVSFNLHSNNHPAAHVGLFGHFYVIPTYMYI